MWTIGILYNALMHKIEFGRSLKPRSINKDSKEIYFIFSECYFIFYVFLKFIWIFENIKENENQKPAHSSEPAPAHSFGLLAQPNRRSGPCAGATWWWGLCG
jgi:hypothetical protein